MAARTAASRDIVARLDEAFAGFACADLLASFTEAGIPCAPVNSYEDVARDPQVRANGYIVEVEHPHLGTIGEIGMPMRFGGNTPPPCRAAPELGQNTEEVLLEFGLTWDEIVDLREKGAI